MLIVGAWLLSESMIYIASFNKNKKKASAKDLFLKRFVQVLCHCSRSESSDAIFNKNKFNSAQV